MIRSILIAQPSVNFSAFLQACDEVLGRKVTIGVDNTSKILSDSERFLSILAALRDSDTPVGLPPSLLTHISFSTLTVSSESDMLDVLESCTGMPFVYSPSKARGILVAIITGTMQQWRDAVVTGTNHSESVVRAGFNQIHDLFVQSGLASVWNNYEQQPKSDGTYLLLKYKY